MWPADSELGDLLSKQPASSVAKLLGVSDRAIAKRCKKLGIETPGLGYWAKKYAEDSKQQS